VHIRFPVTIAYLLALSLIGFAALAHSAELPRMGPPIPTTIVVSKPAPDEIYGNQQVVTLGVGNTSYKFILKDGRTNHLRVKWPDIWEYVRQFNPNFVVQGQDADTFAKIQPGQTVTIDGMFAPMDRTFEVMNIEQSNTEKHF